MISDITCDRIGTNKVNHNSLFIVVTALAFSDSLVDIGGRAITRVCVWMGGEQGEELNLIIDIEKGEYKMRI